MSMLQSLAILPCLSPPYYENLLNHALSTSSVDLLIVNTVNCDVFTERAVGEFSREETVQRVHDVH